MFFFKKEKQNREPWLTVSLSWLVPGAGHLYIGSYGLALAFFLVSSFLYTLWISSLMFTWCSVIISVMLKICYSLILPVLVCVNAHERTKKLNSKIFEENRLLSKEPYKAVFLSLLLPGLGHLYLHKVIFFMIFLIGFIALRVLSIEFLFALILLEVFRVFVCIHSYWRSPIHRNITKTLILFGFLLLVIDTVSGIAMPKIVTNYFLLNPAPLTGVSMGPTIKRNDRIIINKLAYIFSNPNAGDIVALAKRSGPDSLSEAMSCKRIVALEGEEILVKDGSIYVAGKKKDFKIVVNTADKSKQEMQFSNNPEFRNIYYKFGVNEPYLVPKDSYFVLGDNIEDSVDSRAWGAIKKDEIVGKVVKIYWPPSRIGLLY